MRSFRILLFLGTIHLFSCCAKNVKPLIKAGLIPMQDRIDLSVGTGTTNSLSIIYTGCGGILISKGDEAILSDPFYTGQSMARLIFGIKIKPKNTHKVFARLNTVITTSTDIQAVLVAHSHYDHLQDLPYLLEKNMLMDSVKLIGSSSTSCTIKKFMQNESFIDADKQMHEPNNPATGSWISISKHMRVMPIKSGHAPHVGKCYFMKGNTCTKGFRRFNKSESTTAALKWKDGSVYSFVVDILDEDQKPEFRIFLQSSSCQAPSGFPQQSDGKGIDLALLGVASAQNVTDYPNALLEKLQAKKILLIHWEDFFRDMYHKRPKSVRKTDMGKFIKSLLKFYKVSKTEELKQFISMPRPLTEIRVGY